MFAQLGNIKFETVKGFDTWSNGGGDASYAEHEIINGKARLQKTGDQLKELSLTIKFNAHFCNPSQELAALDAAKGAGEILGLLLGDGTYLGDYVIVSTPSTIDDAFANGTPIQITVNLTLKEFVAFSKLEIQQQAARRKAFAVGDKDPVIKRTPQPFSNAATASKLVIRTTEQTNAINGMVGNYEDNVAEQGSIADRISSACDKANKHIDDLNDKLDSAEDLQDKYDDLKNIGADVKTKLAAVKNAFPVQSIDNLKGLNGILQSSMREFKGAAIPLHTSVITRKNP